MKCTHVKDSPQGYGKWHAIFQTGGLDYCRENAPESVRTVAQAKQWAVDIFLFETTSDYDREKLAIDSYRLERW